MTDFKQTHTAEWIEHFASEGYGGAEPLAAGVEGAIYRLDEGTVAKVWRQARTGDLVLMQRFYADVDEGRLPFATPRILRVEDVDGIAVTYERELPGEQLTNQSTVSTDGLDERSAGCVVDILRALATVPATDGMRAMPVLGEEHGLWHSHGDFASALTALLQRRVAVHGDLLRSAVPGFDRLLRRLLERIAEIKPVAPTVVHGDLFGANVLVDESLRATAVLDFGFLSTAGDPRMDAAITAMIMDMYGPHARVVTDGMLVRISDELGYPRDVLLVYQATYAVATSNFFTPDGSDGHYAWCLEQLARPDVADALGLS